MSTPDNPPPDISTPMTKDPDYRENKENWTSSGCLPENTFFDNLETLQHDVAKGRIDEVRRQMKEKDAKLMMEAGQLSSYLYQLIRKAVRIDEDGNLEKI